MKSPPSRYEKSVSRHEESWLLLRQRPWKVQNQPWKVPAPCCHDAVLMHCIYIASKLRPTYVAAMKSPCAVWMQFIMTALNLHLNLIKLFAAMKSPNVAMWNPFLCYALSMQNQCRQLFCKVKRLPKIRYLPSDFCLCFASALNCIKTACGYEKSNCSHVESVCSLDAVCSWVHWTYI